ncbi:unnamed protein product [Penicillium roqueforti FM164]|uniref:Genomic scaffold, ProqFM164S02 n=1 Tax=Penicillium roqueforti (strain FM164) TaxID=1365484 RepID=W6Q3V0_PENRF|nr:unnamed protein product [Penicillium roqueforti FM164]
MDAQDLQLIFSGDRYVLHPCIAASTSALGKDQHTTPPCESDNGGVVMAPSRTPSAAS